MYWLCFAGVLQLHISEAIANSRTNFQIKRFELCNKTQGLIKFQGNITEEQDGYYTTFAIRSPVSLDENIGMIVKIETKVLKSYVEVFVIREKNACKSANIYGGEFWYDVQRAAQVIQGKCPIPAGQHHAHHLKLDFQKLSLQKLTFGEIRFTGGFVENKRPEVYLLCFLIEVDNILN